MPGLDVGFVQIYTGNGKGKTTAAIGLSLRALGHGLKVMFIQFMKDFPYSELTMMDEFPPELFSLFRFGNDDFVINKKKPDETDRDSIRDGIALARQAVSSGQYDLVVLDEINVCPYFGLIEPEDLLPVFKAKKPEVELVLTGRYCPDIWLEKADLISDVTEVKHYYNQGVLSRRGIDS